MIKILEDLKAPFAGYGYRKRSNSFWKIENGFYMLINFQKGAYGGDYYFINIGLHPVGLPKLTTLELEIPKTPSESECIIRQRFEQIIDNSVAEKFRKELVSVDDTITNQEIIKSICAIDQWLMEMGNYKTIVGMKFEDLGRLLSVAPTAKKKAYYYLKCYCAFRSGDNEMSSETFNRYINETIDELSFQNVDGFLRGLLTNLDDVANNS